MIKIARYNQEQKRFEIESTGCENMDELVDSGHEALHTRERIKLFNDSVETEKNYPPKEKSQEPVEYKITNVPMVSDFKTSTITTNGDVNIDTPEDYTEAFYSIANYGGTINVNADATSARDKTVVIKGNVLAMRDDGHGEQIDGLRALGRCVRAFNQAARRPADGKAQARAQDNLLGQQCGNVDVAAGRECGEHGGEHVGDGVVGARFDLEQRVGATSQRQAVLTQYAKDACRVGGCHDRSQQQAVDPVEPQREVGEHAGLAHLHDLGQRADGQAFKTDLRGQAQRRIDDGGFGLLTLLQRAAGVGIGTGALGGTGDGHGRRDAQPVRCAAQYRTHHFDLSRGAQHRLCLGQYLRRHFASGPRAQGDGEIPRAQPGAHRQPARGGRDPADDGRAAQDDGRAAGYVARGQRRRIPHAAFAQRPGAAQSAHTGLFDIPDRHRRRGCGWLCPQIRERRLGHRIADQEVLRLGEDRRDAFPPYGRPVPLRFAQAQGVEEWMMQTAPHQTSQM